MDTTKKYVNPSPERKANILSKIFFWWLVPFVSFGAKHEIEKKDIFNILETESSKRLSDKLEKNWNEICEEAEKNNIKPCLRTAIRRTFLFSYFPGALLGLVRVVFYIYGMPTVLAIYLSYYNEVPRNSTKGWILGSFVMLVPFLCFIAAQHSRLQTRLVANRVAIACSSLVYRKVLRLSTLSLIDTNVGNIVNLLSNDIRRFELAYDLCYIWNMPFVVLVGIYIMYDRVGVVAFMGMGLMVIQAVFLLGYLSKLQGKYRLIIASKTDDRVKKLNEIITGIKVIKMYAWEKPFEKMVSFLRREEMTAITKSSYIKTFLTSVPVFTGRLTIYIVLVTFVVLGNDLTGEVVFPISQAISTLQLLVCTLFPQALAAYSEAKSSISRLEDFLLKPEKRNSNENTVSFNAGRVKLKHLYAKWLPTASRATLDDISFEIPQGSFCCIVGNIGSGKTSILNLILNELPPSSGTIEISGKISYSSQEPWIFTSNIRNNILFGEPYSEEKYNKVIKACALNEDLEIFEFGDKTNVGEKGILLSGGQKARVNLARAIYRDAEIYLLDEPLSAVDPHVAKYIVEKCILEYLANRTRILVTHQIQFLDRADYIVVLEEGRVVRFLKGSERSTINFKLENLNNNTDKGAKEGKLAEGVKSRSIGCEKERSDEKEPKETQELIEKGSIRLKVYEEYYMSGTGGVILCSAILLFFIAQIFCNACDLWVTIWTNNVAISQSRNSNLSYEISSDNTTSWPSRGLNSSFSYSNNGLATDATISSEIWDTSSEKYGVIDIISNNSYLMYMTTDHYVMIYSIFITLAVILTISRSVFFSRICMKTSTKLHSLIFNNLLQTEMMFFDSNPSGRIMNRFSKDIGVLDEVLPQASLSALQGSLVLVGILFMVALKSYLMILPIIVLGFTVEWIRRSFSRVSQQVKRLEGVAKAPVFSYVAASLDGLSTIRSAEAEGLMRDEFDYLQDQHTSTNYLFVNLFQAFALYLDMISLVFISLIVLRFSLDDNAMGGDVGLCLTQSLVIVAVSNQATINAIVVSNNMTAVERILQYTRLDKEGPFDSSASNKPSENWPNLGRILFKNVYLRHTYGGEAVLKNVNLAVKPEEKIGIVGRTGAGKSSFISALLRLAPTEGTIQIDDVDISKIGLIDLRARISIIPQEPVLFSESVRYNLDPFGRCDDATLWRALEMVELNTVITNLDNIVSERGSNFSAGQRQLICLARAIIENNRIVLMDEATANVDQQTDALIQKSIRKNFSKCTVLTISHKLNNIMDCDKVIVMDAGEIKEFAPPYELLQTPHSYFYQMVDDAGDTMSLELKKIAKHHYEVKCDP